MKGTMVGLVCIVLITASSVLWGKGIPKGSLAFPVAKTVHLNCHIKLTKFGLWNLKVDASNASRDNVFDYLYSIHYDVKDSMKDCSAWLKAAKKKLAEASQAKDTEASIKPQ